MSSPRYSKEPPPKNFGGWLRKMRKDRAMPMRVVAAAAEMDQALLCKVELGHRLMTEEQMGKIAKLFGLDETQALGRLAAAKFLQAHQDDPAVAKAAVDLLIEFTTPYKSRAAKAAK